MRKMFAIIAVSVIGCIIKTEAAPLSGSDSVVTEAKKLYCSQVTTAYASEWLRGHSQVLKEKTGGSISYKQDHMVKCVFFSREETPYVLATISFTDARNMESTGVDTVARAFTTYEKDLYTIKKQAEEEVETNSLFKKGSNTNWNIVPLIDKDSRRVYVFAGSKVNGTVVFGNDYLLTYDSDNHFAGVRPLHQNMIPLNYREDKDHEPITTVHNHSGCAADCFTATDICTVMMYEKCANWKKHMVISKTHVSIWDCEKDELVTLTLKDWEKLYK